MTTVPFVKRTLDIDSMDWGFTVSPWTNRPIVSGPLEELIKNREQIRLNSLFSLSDYVERWFFLNRGNPRKNVWEEIKMVKVEDEWVASSTTWLQWLIDAEETHIEVQVRTMEM